MPRRTYPNLSRYLEATGIRQVDLAEKLGLSQGYISRLIRGIQQPSLDEALRISQLLHIPIESLAKAPRDIPAE